MKLLRETIRRLIIESAESLDANKLFVKALYSLPQWKPHVCPWASQSPSNESLAFSPTPECELRVFLITHYDDVIEIARIETAQEYDAENSRYIEDYNEECEGKGYGTQCFNQLIDLADEYDVGLMLEASAYNEDPQGKRPDTAGLTAWYKRMGFEDSPQDNSMLVYNFRA